MSGNYLLDANTRGGHVHRADLDETKSGISSYSMGHRHRIVKGKVIQESGHTHPLVPSPKPKKKRRRRRPPSPTRLAYSRSEEPSSVAVPTEGHTKKKGVPPLESSSSSSSSNSSSTDASWSGDSSSSSHNHGYSDYSDDESGYPQYVEVAVPDSDRDSERKPFVSRRILEVKPGDVVTVPLVRRKGYHWHLKRHVGWELLSADVHYSKDDSTRTQVYVFQVIGRDVTKVEKIAWEEKSNKGRPIRASLKRKFTIKVAGLKKRRDVVADEDEEE